MEYLRINFNQIFNFLPDGKIEPKARIRIGGIEFGPGVQFGRGVQLSGIDIFEWAGKDLAITQEDEIWVIHGYYE
ncbi:MAG: hypothetical protein V1891_02805 [bacterium]